MDFISSCLLVLVVLLIGLWMRIRREHFLVFKRNGIPGPEPSFWTGNYKDLAAKKENCLLEYVKKYGSVVGFFIGAKPFLVIADQELLKIIQMKDFDNFADRDVGLSDAGIPHPEFIHSLFSSRGEQWKRLRSLISPSFTTSKLKKSLPLINEAGDIFIEKVRESCSKGYVNVARPLRNISFDIITKSVLGIDTDVQRAAESKFLDSIGLSVTTSTLDILPALSLCFPEIEPMLTKFRYIRDMLKYIFGLRSVKSAFKLIHELISYRRHSEKREDILQTLIDGKYHIGKPQLQSDNNHAVWKENNEDKQEENGHEAPSKHVYLTDDVIAGNISSLLLGGYETTSITLSYLVYYLVKNQDVQERLREEISEQLLRKKGITYEDLSNLRYMEQVISETLRLHPLNMLTITRIAKRSMKYKDMKIPEGMTLIIPAYTLHRNPENWSDPEKFDPERFSPENKRAINDFVYQPFGSGPRFCVGMRFALIAIKIILTKLIRSYKLERYGDTVKEPKVEYAIFISSLKKLLVKVEPVSQ